MCVRVCVCVCVCVLCGASQILPHRYLDANCRTDKSSLYFKQQNVGSMFLYICVQWFMRENGLSDNPVESKIALLILFQLTSTTGFLTHR